MCKNIEQNKRRVVDWDSIQWDTPKRHVRRLQERIFRATRDKDWAKVKNLQKFLVRSHSARLLAVRRVTQENKGKYNADVILSYRDIRGDLDSLGGIVRSMNQRNTVTCMGS